ncbi:hypothetical protein P3T35_003136 [Kitasatospora sp. GP30]|uniref:hypothetical protein n=1 Tax=Kitasatospora sp. GP30 TaxID=3035084 RepID=UPI000C70D1E5|nr:hypothetical protein [Kitasatospora sp. GP30]MDH6141123.1 hypothetical protein [Kitasatospora sp. GP30]
MATATTPADLIRAAIDTLAAARAAETLLAEHPELPVARLHASGTDDDDRVGPLLEVQLDTNLDALAEYAKAIGVEVEEFTETEFRAVTTVRGVTVWVTAWEPLDSDPNGF